MRPSHSKLRILTLAALIGSTLGIGSAHADFLDAIGRIFGGDPSPEPVARSYQPDPYEFGDGDDQPLGMTVRPRSSTRHIVRKVVRPERPVESVSMNPSENPSWFLDDPTLRRGDIIVLKGEILVYEGGGAGRHSREDFASLDRSRLPPAEKQKLREMAGVSLPVQAAKIAPSQVVAAVAGQN